MIETKLADHTDDQLTALLVDLQRRHSKSLNRARYFALAFILASLIGLRFVPPQIIIATPPIFVVIALLMIVPAFRANAQVAEVIREMQARGLALPSGTPDPAVYGSVRGADSPAVASIDFLNRIKVPGLAMTVLIVLILVLAAVIVITEAPDNSWLFPLTFVLLTLSGIFMVWMLVVMVSLLSTRRGSGPHA